MQSTILGFRGQCSSSPRARTFTGARECDYLYLVRYGKLGVQVDIPPFCKSGHLPSATPRSPLFCGPLCRGGIRHGVPRLRGGLEQRSMGHLPPRPPPVGGCAEAFAGLGKAIRPWQGPERAARRVMSTSRQIMSTFAKGHFVWRPWRGLILSRKFASPENV